MPGPFNGLWQNWVITRFAWNLEYFPPNASTTLCRTSPTTSTNNETISSFLFISSTLFLVFHRRIPNQFYYCVHSPAYRLNSNPLEFENRKASLYVTMEVMHHLYLLIDMERGISNCIQIPYWLVWQNFQQIHADKFYFDILRCSCSFFFQCLWRIVWW